MRLLTVCFFAFLALSAHAQNSVDATSTAAAPSDISNLWSDKAKFTVGYAYGAFDYNEPKMGENSSMNGLVLRADVPFSQSAYKIMAEGSYLSGSGTYQGHYQTGESATAETKNNITNLRVSIGYQLELIGNSVMIPFIGLGFRSLVNPKTVSSSYTREIGYTYLPVGVVTSFGFGSGWLASVRAEYLLFAGGTVKTNYSEADPRYPDFTNKQDHGYGLGLHTNVAKSFGSFSVSVEPYLEYWNVGDSDHFYVNDTSYFMEPENNTTLGGLNVSAIF